MKFCPICRVVKPSEAFRPRDGYPDGLAYKCTECEDRGRAGKHRAREQALAIYGGACKSCGSTERLDLDSPDWPRPANRDRRQYQTLYRRIAAAGARLEDVRLHLLCKSCYLASGLDH
jgi:hypothetical protein